MELRTSTPTDRAFKGTFEDISALLPQFDRRPFALGPSSETNHANEIYDLIVRQEKTEGHWTECPAGIVSKRYRLISHREAAAVLATAFDKVGITPSDLATKVTLPRYAAAMSLEVDLPDDWRFDPGDGHTLLLQLRCQNSVDGTSPLRVALVWYRLVCSNGLVAYAGRDERGFAHREATAIEDIVGFLSTGLEVARAGQAEMQRWLTVRVAQRNLPEFADTRLKAGWGVIDAARFLHIARTGFDAKPADRFQPGPPSEKVMAPTVVVPGSPAKATTAWHVMQALSWVARARKDPAEQIERLREIPGLVEAVVGAA